MNHLIGMEASPKTAEPAELIPAWHDPEELRDRLTRPKATYEQALAQTRRMMSRRDSATPEPPPKKNV